MIQLLRQQLAARHGCEVTQIETHISCVLICGDHAYKFKKALRTPFLDQSTLALRLQACEEELRLNRRLAADLYLAVVAVHGSAEAPSWDGPGAAIDHAVKMRAFAQAGLWDQLALRGELGPQPVDELVRLLARFHAGAAVAAPGGALGTPAQVRAPLLDSLDTMGPLIEASNTAAQSQLQQLRKWEGAAYARLQPLMARRLQQGRVRECHGDLHLGNVTQIDGRTVVFDGIEFNDAFRWIDVMSELSFMAMDLRAHGLPQLAHRFVNGYLEASGDYEGAALLDYYRVHRALVRAKVHLLRAEQLADKPGADASSERQAAQRYCTLALQFTQARPGGAALWLTHGFSGSGKSTLTQNLLEASGAIRIRADVERKRLAGLQALDRSGADGTHDLYAPAMNTATYARLNTLAQALLEAGQTVILDATFLRRQQRQAAIAMAAQLDLRCVMLHFEADPHALRERLRQRAQLDQDASDATEAVLALQMAAAEPMDASEARLVFNCQGRPAGSGGDLPIDWTPLLQGSR